jgi:two-component system OmpR family response regulator
MRSILIVEDDPQLGPALERGIAAEGYETTLVTNGMDALIALSGNQFAAAVVDVMLPAMSGFEICRRVRDTGNQLPMILLTARDAVDDRVTGLDSGADDYLTKPFSFSELSARIRALLRREPSIGALRTSAGNLTLDSETRRGEINGRTLTLSPNEFMLLRVLITKPGETLPRRQLLEAVWGTADHIDANIVEQYVSALRKKLTLLGSTVSIVTVRGVGYRAVAPE